MMVIDWIVIYVLLAAQATLSLVAACGSSDGPRTCQSHRLSQAFSWMGTAERLVTMVLYTFDRGHVAWFIGAWVALKFALNYKRREMKKTLITNKRCSH